MSKPILFDSNIWIYSFDKSDKQKYTIAENLRNKAITRELNVAIAPQNYTEAFRALTDAKLFKSPLLPAEAVNELNKIWQNVVTIFPSKETINQTVKLVRKYPAKSKSLGIYDFFLVATILTAGITTLYTDNVSDFKYFSEIQIVNPFAEDADKLSDFD